MTNPVALSDVELRYAARQARDCAARAEAAGHTRLAAWWGAWAHHLTELHRNRPDTPTPPEIFT